MLFDHLHQFLSALIQRADAGYIAILSDGDKAQLRVITGLCTVSLGHCDLRGADDAFGIHWPHATFSPALQDVVACKIYLIWSRRGFNEPTFRLYCTSFPHLLQLSICSMEPLLFPGCIAGLAGFTPPKPCHAGACTVGSAAGGADKVGQLLTGLPELHGTGGVIHPGLRFGQIPALILAHGALPGPLHLADLVLGVFFPVVLDVTGVELFKALLGPGRRCAQLREDGEKGVAVAPAAKSSPSAVAGGGFKLAADGVGCRDSTKRHTAGKICVSLRLMGQILCYTSDSDPMISQSRAVSDVLSEPPGCFMGDILLEKGTGKMILFYIAVFFAAFLGRLLKK